MSLRFQSRPTVCQGAVSGNATSLRDTATGFGALISLRAPRRYRDSSSTDGEKDSKGTSGTKAASGSVIVNVEVRICQ